MTTLFVTPPFTQLNTPYPATCYLKGFFNTLNLPSHQTDLGIETILEMFSSEGLKSLFDEASLDSNTSPNSQRIYALREEYISTIDPVISFLQNKNPSLANRICDSNFLPEGFRFEHVTDLEYAFGNLGKHDQARHLCTLYLEDLGDFIQENIDENFGFSRYAEKIGRSANSFDEIYTVLSKPSTYIDKVYLQILEGKIHTHNPNLLCISIPFPGNLLGAFRSAQFVKKHFPHIAISIGGGYANTELRRVQDPRVFEFIDFITLDDGELPLRQLVSYLTSSDTSDLKRTSLLENGKVKYYNNDLKDIPQREVGTPDYSDLPLKEYLSVIEVANPMHKLWSDGRWNKLTLAHGCYWGKCTFCDISLDYISRYEPITAQILCDRIEEIIEQTGENGFHFVDEAAPPSLMRDLALEILKRKIKISWWTNIRFEKTFSLDLCRLLAESGCIAISGGLEVASDRLLKLIKKGVSVAQVAKVCQNFTEAGIMVHAYLMFGFPTQTSQETVDSLEMVRQLFQSNVIQSGFWHQFTATVHSPVGMNPEDFGVTVGSVNQGTFANNDLLHIDSTGVDHSDFHEGLKIALFNYMHHQGFEVNLQDWFEIQIPRTSISKDFIENCLEDSEPKNLSSKTKMAWMGGQSFEQTSDSDLLIHHKKFTETFTLHPPYYTRISPPF